MLLRVSLTLVLALGTSTACGSKKGGTLMVDTPALPYKAPDIEELSGVSDDEPDPEPAEEPKAEAPAPPAPVAASPAPTAAPATPAKTPAKPAAPAKPATPKAPAAKN